MGKKTPSGAHPALSNPNAKHPVRMLRTDLARVRAEESRAARIGLLVRTGAYRLRRRISLFFGSLIDEARVVPARTAVDIVTGAPIAALVVPPFRDWMLAFAHPPGSRWFTGKLVLTAVIAFRVLYAAWRRGNSRQQIEREVSAALLSLLAAIESTRTRSNGRVRKNGETDLARRNAVTVVLRGVSDLTRRALRVPEDVRIQSNLMLRMRVLFDEVGGAKQVDGCGIVCYDKVPATPSWTRLCIGDYGAGEVFESGKVEVIEDTRDPHWRGLLDSSRSRCFASFPVRDATTNKVVAVVNVDATRPMVLNKDNALRLFDKILTPHLALLAELLGPSPDMLAPDNTPSPEVAQ